MRSEKKNEAIRREWRELGFFYDRNDSAKAWLIRGSRAGLWCCRTGLNCGPPHYQ